jgi:hypothetical protein
MSTISETISVLEEFNKWRRGDETIPQPEPFEIGVAIGDAVRLLRELTETERLRFNADADRCRLRAELAVAENWVEHHSAHADDLIDENVRLRAEVERLKKQIKDDNRSYGCELLDPYGTIWEQAAKDHARAEKAEAALAEAKVERETVAEASLRSLEAYIDKIKQFAERAERAEAALAFIAEHGGTKHETECGTISCNGLWCAEQARAAIDASMKPNNPSSRQI